VIDAAEFFKKIFGIFNLLTCFVILSPLLSLAVRAENVHGVDRTLRSSTDEMVRKKTAISERRARRSARFQCFFCFLL